MTETEAQEVKPELDVEALVSERMREALRFSPAEQEIVDHIEAAMAGIKSFGPQSNMVELASAGHVMQMFVVAHALQRVGFKGFSRWYWRD